MRAWAGASPRGHLCSRATHQPKLASTPGRQWSASKSLQLHSLEFASSNTQSTIRVILLVHAASRHQARSCCLHDPGCHFVGIAICCRAPVLHVPLAIRLSLARDADRSTAIGNSILEGVDVASLMLPCQALVVALAILGHVFCSNFSEGLAHLDPMYSA